MFQNEWTWIDMRGDEMKSNHFIEIITYFDVSASNLNRTYLAPMYFVAFASLVSWFLFWPLVACKIINKKSIIGSSKDIEVDEDLPNFFDVVKPDHVNELLSEYQYLKESYGVEVAEPDLVKRLKNT
jgi:hypothetical protein